MFIDSVPNRKSPPTILLRESFRKNGKSHKRTLANITTWPRHVIEGLEKLLHGKQLVSAESLFDVKQSLPCGHVEAVLGTMRKLGLETLLSSVPGRMRNIVMGMIAERLLHPCSKLATTRLWNLTTLAEELNITDATLDETYAALDWLLERQEGIENRLAKKHIDEGSLVLYDISSSYYEGSTCPLARYGHNRDGKKDRTIIVYGVMTDTEGRPISVDVYPGNTGDSTTIPDQVGKLDERFNLSKVVVVGDRGMLTETQIKKIKEHPGVGWISALRSGAIRRLVDGGTLQLSLFDKKNLAEISSPDYPGERLIACYNPFLADERRKNRKELLEATEKDLKKIVEQVKRHTKTPLSSSDIGVKAGKIINHYKMGKHFILTIAEGTFHYQRNEESIQREAELDGMYIIRTSETEEALAADDVVRNYKNLARVERAFRCLKGVDVLIRPIYHRTAEHVRAHIFLCMLAYYVEWHMRTALAPMLFHDESLDETRMQRDPVVPAKISEAAQEKKNSRLTKDGLALHSFNTLIQELSTRSRHRCKMNSVPDKNVFIHKITEPSPVQAKAFQLLGLCIQ
jgi:transposase